MQNCRFAQIRDFNPRPPRGGRHGCLLQLVERLPISIHAPREGGDSNNSKDYTTNTEISIHAPREGGDSKDAQFYLRIFDK